MIAPTQTHTAFMKKQKAETYMQIYKYAAEDFRAIPDQESYADQMQAWGDSVETRLKIMSESIQDHTHDITPHSHVMAPHTHMVPQAPSGTLPSGPATEGFTNTETQLMTPTQTDVPINVPQLAWEKQPTPKKPLNSTGATSNLSGNTINFTSTSDIGSNVGDTSSVEARRSKVILILKTPTISPSAKATMKVL